MIGLHLRYVGAVPGVARRELPRIKKAAYEAAGIEWHQRARPKHFTRAGAREYGYKPRKGEQGNPHPKGFKRSYTGQKLKTQGHTLPLVYMGQTRALTRLRDVRAKATGVSVVIRAPGLNRRHPKSKIDMRDEMTAVSRTDIHAATLTIDGTMEREFQQLRTTENKTL